VIALSVLLLPAAARGVTISISLSPTGPVTVGQQFDVILTARSWSPVDAGVDSIAFNVDFDTALFSFVGSSGFALADGTEFLSEANQGGGYSHSDDTSEALVGIGRFIFGASDVGDATAGSIGGADGSGALGGFRLQAIATGTGSITSAASDPNQVFGDTGFFGITPTGGVTFGTASMTVVPEPSVLALLATIAPVALLRRRRRR
jgi:hypothetical protein